MAKRELSHEPMATANAVAVTVTVVYVACALLNVVAPDLLMSIGKTWFHGFDISQLNARTVTVDSFVLGLVSATISSWLVGYVFATLYTMFSKK